MEKLLTIQQLGDILQVSKRTIYDWVHAGFIPCYKFPKGVRFRDTEVEKWLKRRKKKGRCQYGAVIIN